MSWFTDNIRDPLENAIGTGKLSGQAAPAVATTNPTAKSNGFMASPYFVPVAIVLAIIVIAHFLKKG